VGVLKCRVFPTSWPLRAPCLENTTRGTHVMKSLVYGCQNALTLKSQNLVCNLVFILTALVMCYTFYCGQVLGINWA
jgi:hypothetical protein